MSQNDTCTRATDQAADAVPELSLLPVAVQARAAAITRAQAESLIPALQAMWPDDVRKNPLLARAVARVALAYGLDPLMEEVILYQGKPYIGINGRMRKAQENPKFQGLEAWPATPEQRKAYGAREDDVLWYCEAFRSDWRKPDGSPRPARGWGLVRKGDKNFIAKDTPELIAEKRAKARALRDLFNIELPNLPNAEDIDGGMPAPAKWIDPQTGEILDTRPGGMLANRGQIAAIHLLCKQLNLSEEQRHDAMEQMFQKGATNELTEGEAAAFLEFLGNAIEEREAQKPEVIEAKRRETTPYTPPKAASKRFNTAQAAVQVVEAEVVDGEATEVAEESEQPTETQEPPEAVKKTLDWYAAQVKAARISFGDDRKAEMAANVERQLGAIMEEAEVRALVAELTGVLDLRDANAAQVHVLANSMKRALELQQVARWRLGRGA